MSIFVFAHNGVDHSAPGATKDPSNPWPMILAIGITFLALVIVAVVAWWLSSRLESPATTKAKAKAKSSKKS